MAKCNSHVQSLLEFVIVFYVATFVSFSLTSHPSLLTSFQRHVEKTKLEVNNYNNNRNQ
jgi:hypothetical protein